MPVGAPARTSIHRTLPGYLLRLRFRRCKVRCICTTLGQPQRGGLRSRKAHAIPAGKPLLERWSRHVCRQLEECAVRTERSRASSSMNVRCVKDAVTQGLSATPSVGRSVSP